MHQERLEDFINFKSSKKRLIDCSHSRIALNMLGGSKESLNFLKHIEETKDDFLYSPLSQIIDYKWNNQFASILIYNSIYVLYLVFQTMYITMFFEQKWAIFNLLTINFGLFCFESYQFYLEGLRYMLQISNYFDIGACVSMITYCILCLKTGKRNAQEVLLVTATSMYVIRGLLALKVFKPSRNMVYMTSVIT